VSLAAQNNSTRPRTDSASAVWAGVVNYALARVNDPQPGAALGAPAGIQGKQESGAASLWNLEGKEDDAFRELRAMWQRGHVSDDTPKSIAIARQAFDAACKLALPAEILAGAKTAVAAVDAPRFLPALPKWLEARGWEKPPPKKMNRGRGSFSGRRHRDGLPRTNGNKVDMVRLAAMQAGCVEDEDGVYRYPDGSAFGSSLSWAFGGEGAS
jgi:hypothetical protein